MIIPGNDYANIGLVFAGAGLPHGAMSSIGLLLTVDGAFLEAEQWADSFGTNVMPHVRSDITLTEAIIKLGPNETGPAEIYAIGVNGGQGNSTAPPNVAYLISKKTASGGRHNRGRMYVPGVDETHVTGAGDIDAGLLAGVTAGVEEWFSDTLATPVIFHDIDTLTPTPITSLVVSSRVATQRRRLRR